jgi:tRNA dimethylallyltransferase
MTVLALLGPTASGKSQTALRVARARGDVEVVAVDAFTVYRGMDVGTAKPTVEERASVPHHLVDVVDPDQELTVAQFQTMAREAIADVRSRGRVPLLVGGSGLYWRAVVDDLRFPPTDPEVRAEIERRWEGEPSAAHAELRRRDPAAADRIEPANLRRTVRALEVLELTGEPFSAFSEAWDRFEAVYEDLEVALLDPPGEELREAIDRRARRMVEDGLLSEARELRSRWRLSRTAAQGIGYAEAFAVLDGREPAETLAAAVARRTRRYARRQRAWFRRDPRAIPLSPGGILSRWGDA